MKNRYVIENLLREPVELYSATVMIVVAIICYRYAAWIFLTPRLSLYISVGLLSFSVVRFWQGLHVISFHRRLLKLPLFSMSTTAVPVSHEGLYVGQGFRWLPLHRQRLHLLGLMENQHFLQKYQKKSFHRASEVGGKPWIHGVGSDQEHAIYLKQTNRNAHAVVFGMTRVGKTRLMSILVNQDIRHGEAVLVLDPKGDTDLIKDMYAACKSVGRLNDFYILHAGMPEISAKYNPLSSYANISEIATRVTSAIQAEGEGRQFADFAWRFLNITATCLKEMGEDITYRNLAFFVTRPKQLLLSYCDAILPTKDPHYEQAIQQILAQPPIASESRGRKQELLTRADAVRHYVAQYIETLISQGAHQSLQDSIIADLCHAAQTSDEYYSKITASLGPVFDKINKTAAGDVFSWQDSRGLPVIQLEEVIAKKQVVYMGLDAMSNKAMSDAVGQAVIADLISLCGRLYKDNPDKDKTLFIHADEFSEIVRDEFVTLLNKAGGAGVRVTAYTQTVNDLGAVFGNNPHKYKMLLGNFGTMIMLRVANLDTARVFTECLEYIKSRSSLPSTMSQDKSYGENGEFFSTNNTDVVNEEKTSLITENDVYSLPKGQAFVLTNGGELYKIRIPLPVNEEESFSNSAFILSEVNLCYAKS